MLDINTAKGQLTLEQERQAAQVFLQHHPKYQYVSTPKDRPADVDGLLVLSSDIAAVVEVKCRNMNYDTLMNVFDGEWLITYDKIEKARRVAMSHRVPLVGWLWLAGEKLLLVQRICDQDGTFTVPMKVETTTTQATVNGGVATRSNAFISMQNAKQLREHTC